MKSNMEIEWKMEIPGRPHPTFKWHPENACQAWVIHMLLEEANESEELYAKMSMLMDTCYGETHALIRFIEECGLGLSKEIERSWSLVLRNDYCLKKRRKMSQLEVFNYFNSQDGETELFE